MDSSVGNFYFEIKYSSFTAFAQITDTNVWRMLRCEPDSEWPPLPTWRRGTWERRGQVAHCYSLGTGVDAVSSNNQTKLEVFRLVDVEFPPDLSSQQGFWIKQFFLSDLWADQKHIQKGIVKVAPHKLAMPTHGSWTPFITGPLITATEQKLRAYQEEIKKLAIQIGLDIASVIDPTGVCSIPAAGYAMNRGDYLGCCINLLGVIPLFGKLAPAAKVAIVSERLAFLTKEITFLEKWLEISTDATRRVRQSEQIAGALKVELQGTTKATMLPKVAGAAAEAAEGLKNLGWIHKIFNPERLGMLPEEIQVLRALAKDGYYFVIRSCNPTRAQWLRSARANGWGMIGKPVWLKIKSLKNVKFAGLVGFHKLDVEFYQTIEHLELVKELPASVRLPWLAQKGVSRDGVKVYRLTKNFNVAHVEDPEMMLTHYFVDTGDAFIIVDRFGRPYVPDLDIVSIQRAVGKGRFGPAGYNVGPAKPLTKFACADNAELSSYWNRRFANGVRYPPGYDPFGWHGGWGGSAAFTKSKLPKNFVPGIDVRKLGWNPEKPEEDLVVAVQGVANLGDDVGYVTGWDKLGEFTRANSGMGEFRFEVNK
jgi:hypothetical protein